MERDFDVELKKFEITALNEKAENAVAVAVAATAATGGIPIPFADAPLLIAEQVALMVTICGIYGIDKKKTEENIKKITEQFSLTERLNQRAGKLSGGWQRKLSIALALVTKPKVLFLDEPTLGLDVIARRELWNTILSLKGQTTIILTTHYMEEAETLSDRIAIMKNGQILFVGDKEKLYTSTNTTKIEDAFIQIVQEGDSI